MADVLAPTQKLDGQANVAGPPLVDLSKLDAPKAATNTAEKQPPTGDTAPTLTKLQLTDDSQIKAAPDKAAEKVAAAAPEPAKVTEKVAAVAPEPAKVTEKVTPAPAVQPVEAAATPVAAAVKVAENPPTAAAAAADCDKSTACSFTPTTDHEKSKAWWDARAQLVGTAPEKDPNCLYTVKFGDDLSTIAQRQLQAEGKAVNTASLKAEQDKLVALNDAQYKSLDCNRHYLQAGWRLKLTDDYAATPAPAPVEAAPQPQPKPAPVEAPLPPPPPVEAPLPPPPPREGQLPPLRPEDCDHSYNSRIRDGEYRREDHMYQAPGHHIILNFNNMQYQYDVPPGKSIIYDDNGRQRMITECNENGSRPRHSEIIYRIDHEGRRHGVSADEQHSYYRRFAPDYLQNYDGYRDNGGLPVQDRFSIEERRVNEQRRIHDEELRRIAAQREDDQRIQAERQAAERHRALLEQQNTTGTRVNPEVQALTPAQIEALPSAAERTAARAAAMEKLHHQQGQEKLAKQQKQQEQQQQQDQQLQQQQEQRDQALKARRDAEQAKLHQQPEQTRQAAPVAPAPAPPLAPKPAPRGAEAIVNVP